MIKPLTTAFRILTILPIPGKDTDNFSHSIPFFPVVGLLLGAVVFVIFKGSELISFDYTLITSIIALLIVTLLTGALHIDGLGDVADGFGSGKSKEEILTIFKDSRMGTFGVCAIVFDLLIKTFCWNELFKAGEIYVIIMSLIISRCIQSLYLVFLPTARETSTLSPFIKNSNPIKISVLCVVALFFALSSYYAGFIPSILYFMSASFIAILFGIYCMKKIGGITGDCVGAINEISEVGVLGAGILIGAYL